MKQVQLNGGWSVHINGYACVYTYGGMLEGRPNQHVNGYAIEKAQSLASRIWPDESIHLISPVVDDTDPDHPRLPSVTHAASLVSYEPVDPAFMASSLVVVWFTDEQDNLTLPEQIHLGVQEVSWSETARSFDW